MTLSEALELVAKLLDGFPHGRPPNQTSYMGALASVLCQYPRMVAANVADPVKGGGRETRFLPTIADLVGWCERESAFLRGLVDREDHDVKLAREREKRRIEHEREIAARRNRPSLEELKAQYGPNWGLMTMDEASATAKRNHLALAAEAGRREFERECAEAGVDPAGGVSPSLRKLLQEQHS